MHTVVQPYVLHAPRVRAPLAAYPKSHFKWVQWLELLTFTQNRGQISDLRIKGMRAADKS